MSKFLTLRRPTTISKLLELVPQDPDTLPREVVPQWIDLIPSVKLPNRCCPVHAVEFSTGPLAQFPWEYPNDHEFDLEDPYIRIAPKSYHVLHDKHLRKYWTEVLKKNLKHHGLISENERVLCTLMELNRFRSFLSHHHRLHVLELLHQMQSEKANAVHCKQMQTHLKNAVDFCEKLATIRDRSDRIYNKKMDQWKTAVEKCNQQTDNIIKKFEMQKQKNMTEGHLRDLKNKKRYCDLLALRKRKNLVLRRKLKERDVALQQRMMNNKRRSQEIKTRMKIEHFRMHYLAYLKERNENRQYLESFLTQMHHKVQDRKEMYDRKHKKLEQDLVRRKTRYLASKYYRRSKALLVKALLRECKKSVCAKSFGKTSAMVNEKIERAIDAAYAIHTTISPTTSSTQIIDTASQFILDLHDGPIEPLPQDSLITGYVIERLREMMHQIIQKSVQEALTLIEQVAARKSKSLNRDDQSIRSSLSNQGSIARLASFQVRVEHPKLSRVSMGPASIVEQYETESFTLKKCKYRPPTPVTSVTSLVEHTFHQSKEERISISALEVSTEAALDVLRRIHSESNPLIHVMYSQRRYLEANLLKYRMILQPYVVQRVLAAIDLDRLTTVSCVEVADSGATKREAILRLTASALLKFPDSSHQYAVALFDTVNFLSRQAIGQVQQILSAP
ncbi:uncharacterized protein LOC126567985 [Anopheles maculipalpis]|uniref:uncharacterized protein LOC126567985 n=1 Tax=Anopheles maculipalpis TaxID=1496333 RepID=UPI0021596104|nr:uncharacterized protein LOC126567985 [Anopheles maculipalpis]